jgi:hypothetical protein
MTCTHVIGLIDAGPFVDYPRDHREAARAHARQCATCSPALAAADAVTTRLQMIPTPVPARDLTGDILARAAAVDETRREMPATAAGAARVTSRALWVPASATALAAAAVGAALAAGDASLFRVAPFTGGGVHIPSTGAAILQLVTGLALYAFGLLVPLNRNLVASTFRWKNTLRSSDQ